jgi:hypothetical protein
MTDRRDPTRSAGLRRQGRTQVNRRVFELHKQLRAAFSESDVAGLRAQHATSPPLAFVNWLESSSYKLARSEGAVSQIVARTLTAQPGWIDDLIERAVDRGLEQVEQELSTSLGNLDAGEVSRLHAAAASTELRGIAGETERRVLRHVVRALETKASPEALMREVRATLEKITRLRLTMLVNVAVVRAVNGGKLFAYEAEGIRQVGIAPEWLPHSPAHQRDSVASDHHGHQGVTGLIDKRSTKAKRRARVLKNKAKRTRRSKSIEEQILAAAFPEAGAALAVAENIIEQVEQQRLVNVLTAGDDRVCQDCEDIAADGPYDIDEARGLIPAHPNCRCAFIPFGDKRFAPIEEQLEEL